MIIVIILSDKYAELKLLPLKLSSIRKGRLIAEIMLDKEMILLKLRIVRNIPKQAVPTCQVRPKSIPRPVATALPPFQPSHMGQMWPAKAVIPAVTCQ